MAGSAGGLRRTGWELTPPPPTFPLARPPLSAFAAFLPFGAACVLGVYALSACLRLSPALRGMCLHFG